LISCSFSLSREVLMRILTDQHEAQPSTAAPTPVTHAPRRFPEFQISHVMREWARRLRP
jgi:hypothetical protein